MICAFISVEKFIEKIIDREVSAMALASLLAVSFENN